ncbi:MAG: hypothetical protein IKA63_04210, partial [Clostridia bacterium]|nr:hypothetical protein [Clostridia bacterium]
YVSVLQIAQVTAMLLMSRAADDIKDIRKGVALTLAAFIPFFGVLLFISMGSGMSSHTKYLIIFIVSILLNLALGLYCILAYKLPHHIMNIQDYGKTLGQSGVISGVVCMALSALMPFLLSKCEYFSTMAVLFGVGILMGILTPMLCLKFRTVSESVLPSSAEKINIFRYKPFYQLIIPNFMRGFSTGILNLITVIGYACGILDSSAAAIVVILTQAASLLSCQSYSFLIGKYRGGNLLLVSAVTFCVAISLAVIGKSKWVFFVCYFLAYFFINHTTTGVPVLVANRIEYNCLGQYTAWRMALHTLGVAVGGACVPFLLKCVGAAGTLVVCGVTALPCGIGYYWFEKQVTKQKKKER